MILSFHNDQHEALKELVSHAVADLRHGIADTDNWEYRAMLRSRRDRITEISGHLDADEHRARS